MSDWRVHTPNGLADILPDECEKKKNVENIINNVFLSMGYREIETPSFEYYDVFSGDSGQISQENMFKFFDEKGYNHIYSQSRGNENAGRNPAVKVMLYRKRIQGGKNRRSEAA